MKGESDTKEPEDADGDQVATDVISKGRRRRNVPMGDEGQWKDCSYGICQASQSLRDPQRSGDQNEENL
jgi:hypothetical protein